DGYVHLLTISPEVELAKDEVICYELSFNTDVAQRRLADLGLVGPAEVPTPTTESERDGLINRWGLPLPSFVIPSRLASYLHGSCYKLHGEGAEAFSRGEQVLQQWAMDARQRPACLFLTGDQIYGDDVDPRVLQEVLALGQRLGFREYEAEWLRKNRDHLTSGRR